MQKWKYRTEVKNSQMSYVDLNVLGEQGWELATHCVEGMHYYTFKKLIEI